MYKDEKEINVPSHLNLKECFQSKSITFVHLSSHSYKRLFLEIIIITLPYTESEGFVKVWKLDDNISTKTKLIHVNKSCLPYRYDETNPTVTYFLKGLAGTLLTCTKKKTFTYKEGKILNILVYTEYS